MPNNSAPILLIIFNRPDTLQFVFDAIRKNKPKKLYVSADAPREGNENDKLNCEKAREIVKAVDWDCETHYRFLDHNLGCGMGVSSAITWAFEKEDRLIILEDDCVPSAPFFEFCNYCLEEYKNDCRVYTINGRSHHPESIHFKNYDFLFSYYAHCWGWATWKRVWNDFDINVGNWSEFIESGGFQNVFFSKQEVKFFNQKYDILFSDKNLKSHSWAYPFSYYALSNAGLSIVPSKNLIKNIGVNGVHSSGNELSYHKLNSSENYTFRRKPTLILPNRAYDYFHFKKHMLKIMRKPSLFIRGMNKIFRLIGLK